MPKPRTLSESAAWDAMLGLLEQAETGTAGQRALQIDRAKAIAVDMLAQVRHGVHANPRPFRPNPGLLVWPNPGGMLSITLSDLLSRRAFALSYKHREDGKDYEHPFDPGVDVFTVTLNGDRAARSVLLTRRDGLPLWKDF